MENELCVKERVSWKGAINHPLKNTIKIGPRTGWDGLTMIWVKLRGMEVSSWVKAETVGSWKDVFVGGDEGRRDFFSYKQTKR